jgi:hypothetical protein
LQKKKEAAQYKAQINTQKKKRLRAKQEKKLSSTQEANRCIFLGEHPALSISCDHFKNRLCDEEDEMTAEIQGTDVAQPLPGDVEYAECIFCMCLFSVGNDCENWIRCGICCKWSQTLCAHLEGEVFFCDMCK